MKIAFVGHPYHQKTRSADFFVTLLEKAGLEIEKFYDDFFYSGSSSCLEELIDGDHDAIFLWQTEYLAPQLTRVGKKVATAPMYDAARLHDPKFWHALSLTRVISFCRKMHDQLQTHHVDTNYFQYFPNPDDYAPKPVTDDDDVRGFVWLRRPWDGVSWPQARALIRASGAASSHVHVAIDEPAQPHTLPTDEEVSELRLTQSQWFESKQELHGTIQKADFFVSPRYYEGIGMSFLETMALGVCPLCPDTPTMNEYIYHGENGLFYDVDSEHRLPELSKADLRKMGAEARASVERGYERWTGDIDRLVERVTNLSRPAARFKDFSTHFRSPKLPAPSSATAKKKARPRKPKLSVVTVVRNDAPGLRKTLASLAGQSFKRFEYIIMDGASDTDMLEAVSDLPNIIHDFVSEPDDGPYDAMMKGAARARGDYVYFLNAGDTLYAKDTLERAMAAAEPGVDFIYGDHVWVRRNGQQLHHRAPHFDQTWEVLQRGYLTPAWLQGIPAHQAVFTRREMLVEHGFDLRYQIAADHEFMFRMRREGAVFRHCQDTVALYGEGGMSSERFQRCQAEWYTIADLYGSGDGIHDFYAPALGYDLRRLNRFSEGKVALPLPARDRASEFAGMVANRLKGHQPTYNFARNVWRRFRPPAN